MPFEMSITLKNEEKRLTLKHLIYEACEISPADPIIIGAVESAIKEFGSQPDNIAVKINLDIR